jgi:signal transduction histidine kinase
MQMLVTDLLAYTRSLEGGDEGQAIADGNDAISEVLSNLRIAIEGSAGEVTYDPLPILPIHRAHLIQLLQNLIGNGLKYGGDRPPKVRISAAKTDQDWMVSVTDNGIGIPEKHRERIFGVFKRLHGSEVPGSGIGLAICARIVGHYHGRIWVDPAPGGGSIFSFTLPSREGAAVDANAG